MSMESDKSDKSDKIYSSEAQVDGLLPFKEKVVGSRPTRGT